MSTITPVDPADLVPDGVRLRDQAGEVMAIQCSTCRVRLPREAFQASEWQRGSGRCRACTASYTRDRRTRGVDWRNRNPQGHREALRRTRATSEGRKADREASRAWKVANPERALHGQRRTKSRRRLRALGRVDDAIGFTFGQAWSVWLSQDGLCYSCRRPTSYLTAHEDHLIALSGGGTDSIDNIGYQHPSCSRAKGARSREQYIADIAAGEPLPALPDHDLAL